MQELRIRPAEPADNAAISRLLACSWKAAYKGLVHQEYLEQLNDNSWLPMLEMGISDPHAVRLVLEQGQQVIGVALFYQMDMVGTVELVSFYLLPEFIGKGVGHLFYAAAEEHLVELGFELCVLHVLEGNRRAIQFYQLHGFQPLGDTVVARLGDQDYLCHGMAKQLHRKELSH